VIASAFPARASSLGARVFTSFSTAAIDSLGAARRKFPVDACFCPRFCANFPCFAAPRGALHSFCACGKVVYRM
jgi:hypothetical protein